MQSMTERARSLPLFALCLCGKLGVVDDEPLVHAAAHGAFLVVQGDLEHQLAALHSGQLGFYGADAFVTEPLPQESPLRAEPHAILTPHIAWTTREALQNLMDITTRNLRTWLEGNGEHIVNR